MANAAPAPSAPVKSSADDLFSVDFNKMSSKNGVTSTRPSDDLLMLATDPAAPNPFTMSLNSAPQAHSQSANLFQNNLFGAMSQPMMPPAVNNNMGNFLMIYIVLITILSC